MKHEAFEISKEEMDQLFPLHVAVKQDGTISSVGPTLLRILGEGIVGRSFFDGFAVRKPRQLGKLEALCAKTGTKLRVTALTDRGEEVAFRGVATLIGKDQSHLLVDLSFGSALGEAVKRFKLSSSDFRPNDAAIDLLYTFETQQTLIDDSRKLAEALKDAKDDVEQKAYIDVVTGIANRRALHSALERALIDEDAEREFAILHIDLDRFKSINDTFGQAAGDLAIRRTAECIQWHARHQDVSARLGGDEFALVLTDPPDDASLIELADVVRHEISRPVKFGQISFSVEASVGIVRFQPSTDRSIDTLLMKSSIALNEAKETGNGVTLLTPALVRRHDESAKLVAELESAIERKEFVPFFQAQIDAAVDEVVGLEVLARWRHPVHGIRPPVDFIETAVRTNLMGPIDRLVRKTAIETFASWREARLWDGKLSFNLSAQNLRSEEFVEEISDELFIAGLTPQSIQLELLESIMFDETDETLHRQAQTLLSKGFTLALDDFGTGHASIATLIDVPVSLLKIDRSFVTGLEQNTKLQRITGSMLAMASEIGLDVLAEGIETAGELAFLENAGCRLFQGYFFAKPQDAAATEHWLGNRSAIRESA